MFDINIQSSIRFDVDKVIYFDPIKLDERHDADYIFITHPHYDHFDKETILNLKNDYTKIIGPKDIYGDALEMGFSEDKIMTVMPNETYDLDDMNFKCVPAYNIDKPYHLKEYNWVGYVMEIAGIIYYIAGDTDALLENEKIICEVAMVPIGGTYTMDAREAAEFVNKMKPKVVVPYHYGMVVGTEDDFKLFASLVDSSITVQRAYEKN